MGILLFACYCDFYFCNFRKTVYLFSILIMRKFIKLFILFSSPIIIGMISFEIFLRIIPNEYSIKRKYLDSNSNKIKVLFLGSSHVYYGINPEYMSIESFNAAHVSQSLNYDFAILEKYRSNWKELKYLILPIDYFSLFTTLENGIEKWRVKNYSTYYDIRNGGDYWVNFEIFNGPLPGNISRAFTYIFNQNSGLNCNKWGFGNTYNSKVKNDLIATGKTAARRHTVDNLNTVTFSKNIEDLHSIINFSQKNKIKLIFITCPAYYTYRDNLNQKQLLLTLKVIRQLASENSNTAYYNFLSDTSFVDTDFYDADHLNEIGAKKFTFKIEEIIKVATSNKQ